MADLLGFNAIIMATLFVFILAKKVPAISVLLIVALLIRIFWSLFNYYIGGLPDSGNDAAYFELLAWTWSQGDFSTVFSRMNLASYIDPNLDFAYEIKHAYVLSWVLSLLYNLTDRSLLMLQTVSVMFGMGSIYLGWKLSAEIWSEEAAVKSAWVMALFPSWVLYSVLTMREVYVYFFMLYGLIGVVKWVKFNKLRYLVRAIVGFFVATLFHGAMFLGLAVFFVFVFYRNIIALFRSQKNYKQWVIPLIILIGFIVGVVVFFQAEINIPYINHLDDKSLQKILNRTSFTSYGGSEFPSWIIPHDLWELVWKTPIRVLYFLFSPFPWDISKPSHIIGFIDAVIYFILFSILWKNREFLFKNQSAKILATMLALYILAFSMGIGNSGTALRHRAKMFPIIVVLAAPFLPVITFRKDKSIRRKDVDELFENKLRVKNK
jgi:hypothetical protein